MSTADVVFSPVKRHPRATTALLSLAGYGAVAGTFVGVVPASIYPDLTLAQVNLVSHAIAAVNLATILLLGAGWVFIRRGETQLHAAMMSLAFTLILVFLGLYLVKIGGGGTKEFVGPAPVRTAYVAMLAVHVLLSVVAVPVVLYAVVLGVTHSPAELRRETPHRRVGRVAATTWITSLALGLVTYVLLNHVYGWEYVAS